MRRKPNEDRWNADLVRNLWGVPWKVNKDDKEEKTESIELPYPIEIEPEEPDVPNVSTEVNEGTQQLRKTYLTKRDLLTYGYTQGCPACAAISGGFSRSGVVHSDECRKRLEEKLRNDPEGNKRLKRTEEKEIERLVE